MKCKGRGNDPKDNSKRVRKETVTSDVVFCDYFPCYARGTITAYAVFCGNLAIFEFRSHFCLVLYYLEDRTFIFKLDEGKVLNPSSQDS